MKKTPGIYESVEKTLKETSSLANSLEWYLLSPLVNGLFYKELLKTVTYSTSEEVLDKVSYIKHLDPVMTEYYKTLSVSRSVSSREAVSFFKTPLETIPEEAENAPSMLTPSLNDTSDDN